MKKNTTNPEKNDNKTFAFLPEMILEHLNHSEFTEFEIITYDEKKDQTSNLTTLQAIIFDPLADPFDGMNIEIIQSAGKKNKKK